MLANPPKPAGPPQAELPSLRPKAPNMIIRPLSSGIRSLGNQSTRAFKPAVNDAATPRPISARPPRSSQIIIRDGK